MFIFRKLLIFACLFVCGCFAVCVFNNSCWFYFYFLRLLLFRRSPFLSCMILLFYGSHFNLFLPFISFWSVPKICCCCFIEAHMRECLRTWSYKMQLHQHFWGVPFRNCLFRHFCINFHFFSISFFKKALFIFNLKISCI